MQSNETLKKIWEVLSQFSLLFENPPSGEKLKAMCAYLAKFADPEQIKSICETLLRSQNKFPSIKEFLEIINPENPETEAIEATSRIFSAIRNFGWTNPDKARSYMGELAWETVERNGGWQNVCETCNQNNVGILKAQYRESAKTIWKRTFAGIDSNKPVLPKPLSKLKAIEE